MSLYDKPVRILLREMVTALELVPGRVFTKDEVLDWFKTNYPLVKEGTITAHLIRFSTNDKNRLHYGLRDDGTDDVFFKLDGRRFRLFEPASDVAPIHGGGMIQETAATQPADEQNSDDSEFAYEDDLRDYLAQNLHLIEPGLVLYSDEGISGIEFPVGGRFVDILAVDSAGGYVVIELKVSRGYDRVVGQLLRYIGWIEKHHAESGQRVRGVIVAKEVSEDLRLACARIPDIRLFEYMLLVSLREVNTQYSYKEK